MQWFAVLAVAVAVTCCYGKGIPGGAKPVSVKDPQVQKLAEFVVSELKSSNGTPKKELGEMVSATVQIVSGTLTNMMFKTDDGEKCSVTVWEQPWLQRRVITESTCGHDVTKRSTKKSDNHMEMFHEFMLKHNRQYKSKDEYKKRYHVFKANLKKVKLFQDNEQGTAKYGVTQFSDMTEKEFKRHLGLKKPEKAPVWPQAQIPDIELPQEYDWRNYNAVTPVKNQGSCGSCWAFSVTGNIEGQWAIKKGQLLSLSEQEIVDCDTSDQGCNGGYMTTAYESIVRLGGLEEEKAYPYEGEDEKCNLDQSEIEVRIEGGLNITKDEDGMAKWLVQNGPISVALNANVMQFYLGGVSHPFKFLCSPEDLDHGVLIVGYGVHTSTILKRTLPYWIVKNSWGKGWGELGYYRLYRGDGSCGINQMASSAVV